MNSLPCGRLSHTGIKTVQKCSLRMLPQDFPSGTQGTQSANGSGRRVAECHLSTGILS